MWAIYVQFDTGSHGFIVSFNSEKEAMEYVEKMKNRYNCIIKVVRRV